MITSQCTDCTISSADSGSKIGILKGGSHATRFKRNYRVWFGDDDSPQNSAITGFFRSISNRMNMTLNTKSEQHRLDAQWMAQAIQLASRAEAEGEVPIGAVAVYEGEVVGRGWNRSISTHDPSAHAEIMALREAGHTLKNYRLCEVTLYVTLEPCAMCAGAMLHARIARLVVGATDPKTGAAGSVLNVLEGQHTFHQVVVEKGLLAEACAAQLRQFFRNRRAAAKSKSK